MANWTINWLVSQSSQFRIF
uniref:Uncharacterized protein n=1 Tax=Anguilla anguilla TaxID=7936 RepID=A0A0E9U0F9_ANGAN